MGAIKREFMKLQEDNLSTGADYRIAKAFCLSQIDILIKDLFSLGIEPAELSKSIASSFNSAFTKRNGQ
tara:strand:+ start:23594 stop:23800 length:207 start_codon:yes stop_codon:yes gene_type:complete